MAKRRSMGGRPAKEGASVTPMKLSQKDRAIAKTIGSGNMTAGVEKALSLASQFYKTLSITSMPDSKFEIGDEVHVERGKPGVVINKSYEPVIVRQQVSGLETFLMAWNYQIIGFGFDPKEWYGEDTLTPSSY